MGYALKMALYTDQYLVERLLSPKYSDKLSADEREMLYVLFQEKYYGLTVKQRRWVYAIAERLGVRKSKAAKKIKRNLFSSMPESERQANLAQVKTLLPWERPGYVKPVKPPTRAK